MTWAVLYNCSPYQNTGKKRSLFPLTPANVSWQLFTSITETDVMTWYKDVTAQYSGLTQGENKAHKKKQGCASESPWCLTWCWARSWGLRKERPQTGHNKAASWPPPGHRCFRRLSLRANTWINMSEKQWSHHKKKLFHMIIILQLIIQKAWAASKPCYIKPTILCSLIL